MSINAYAWLLNAAEGYKLSKPFLTKVTHLLYVDDLKVFAASECKLNRVLRSICNAMQDHWNSKKCNVIHVRRGKKVQNAKELRLVETTVVKSLTSGFNYKFLGIRESSDATRESSTYGGNEGVLEKIVSNCKPTVSLSQPTSLLYPC